jgi:hypothetical protein
MRVFRPLADIFPLIEVEEFDPLVASINASNGRPHKNSPPSAHARASGAPCKSTRPPSRRRVARKSAVLPSQADCDNHSE